MKRIVKLSESSLRRIISESVKNVLNEQGTPETLIEELQGILECLNSAYQDLNENFPDFEMSNAQNDLNFAADRIETLIRWTNEGQEGAVNFSLGDDYGGYGYNGNYD